MRGERVIQQGFQKGRQSALIDGVITQVPKTTEQIADETGLTAARVKSHCAYWMKEGLFYGETPDGKFFRLATGEQPRKR